MTKAEKADRSAARRFSTPYSCYECELPPNILAELLCPRGASREPRERWRQRALSPPRKRKPGFGFSCRLLVVLAVGLCVFWAGESCRAPRVSSPLPVSRSGTLQQVVPAPVSPIPAPLPIAAPGALEQTSANAPFSLGVASATQRWNVDATAGKIPEVRRATRVFTIGKLTALYMPDGAVTVARFWGIKNSFFELPDNPQLGDAWQVLEGAPHLWVWYRLPGHANAGWVDP